MTRAGASRHLLHDCESYGWVRFASPSDDYGRAASRTSIHEVNSPLAIQFGPESVRDRRRGRRGASRKPASWSASAQDQPAIVSSETAELDDSIQPAYRYQRQIMPVHKSMPPWPVFAFRRKARSAVMPVKDRMWSTVWSTASCRSASRASGSLQTGGSDWQYRGSQYQVLVEDQIVLLQLLQRRRGWGKAIII